MVFPMSREIVRPFSRKLLPERLGHEGIDSDHMEISNCWCLTVNCGPLQFPFLVGRMKKLMQKHFASEAAIMRRFDRSLPPCHQTEHDLLLRFCDDAAKLSQYSWAKAQRLLRRDFPRHVREHIICMDQLVVLYVNTHGELGSCRKTRSRLHDF
jgi:hemerythrin